MQNQGVDQTSASFSERSLVKSATVTTAEVHV